MRELVLAVLVAGCSANDDVPAPMIASVVPDHAPGGALVVVDGMYFCQRPATGNEDPTCAITGSVAFGSAPGTAASWSDSVIMVEVPQGAPGRADVSLTVAGRTSNTVAFTLE